MRNSTKALLLLTGGFVVLLAASFALTALFSERVAYLILFGIYMVVMVWVLRKTFANDADGET